MAKGCPARCRWAAHFTATATAYQPASLSINGQGGTTVGSVVTITNADSDDDINTALGVNFGARAGTSILSLDNQGSPFTLPGFVGGAHGVGTQIGAGSTNGLGGTVTSTVTFTSAAVLNGTYAATIAVQFEHDDQTILGTAPHDLSGNDFTMNVANTVSSNADPHTGSYVFTGGTYTAPPSITLNGSWAQSGGTATFSTFNVNGTVTQSGGAGSFSTLHVGSTGSFSVTGTHSPARTDVVGAEHRHRWKDRSGANDMVVNGTPFSTVQPLVASGVIRSSAVTAAATSGHPTALAVVTAGSVGSSSFDNISVNPSDVLIRYTYAGDSNIDGVVDTSDFTTMANHFGSTSATWVTGDFNYDGKVNALDFNSIASNFGSPAIPAPPVWALVPEPCAVALLAVAPMLLARRKRAR